MRIVAVIPCYNEAHIIGGIVAKVRQYVDEVVVADDASGDATACEAGNAGAFVVKCTRRGGFGRNVMSGINVAMVRNPDIVVTLDGDGQHDPDEIPQVVGVVRGGEADMAIGSRFLGEYDAPRYRKFGIDVITWLYNVGRIEKITDGQSCFRAYRRELLESVDIREGGFGFSTEILIKARLMGYRIKEVPIRCIYHKDFRMNSTMNPVVQGISVALCTAKWRLRLKQ